MDRIWKIEARFIPYDPPREILFPTVLVTIDSASSPGQLVFDFRGKTFTLDPFSEEGQKNLFIVFSDETTGGETYGGGRFLDADRPDEKNVVILDFNKAYNPPCAFTEFATCPSPPEQNKLAIRVMAGAKKYMEH